jgi:hypothetical protein
MTWVEFYNLLGIKDFIYFISSPDLQEMLFPAKIIFIAFTIFFLGAVIYFMRNSSYLQYKFFEDVTEFFSYQAYGLKEINKRWKKIMKRTEGGIESEYKLALIEADDFLSYMLDDRGIEGKDFNEMIEKGGRALLPNTDEILAAHEVRNSIVYDSDYKLDIDKANKLLAIYETTIKNIGVS